MSAPGEKAALRQMQLQGLRELSAEDRVQESREILRHLQAWEGFRQARCVLLYAPLKNEPDLLELLALGKKFCFPRVQDSELGLYEVQQAAHLQKGSSWIREPDPAQCPMVDAGEIDLAVIPGLAFDPESHIRLGRGGGYYDRLLARKDFTARTMGVCFTSQLRPGLPKENHDVPMHAVVSSKGFV